MLAVQIGVGGTTALVQIMQDTTLSNEQKGALLKLLFNLTDEQVKKLQ